DPEETSPCSLGSSPEAAFSVVDFPAPFEPSNATILPLGTFRDSPRNTRMTSSSMTSILLIASRLCDSGAPECWASVTDSAIMAQHPLQPQRFHRLQRRRCQRTPFRGENLG